MKKFKVHFSWFAENCELKSIFYAIPNCLGAVLKYMKYRQELSDNKKLGFINCPLDHATNSQIHAYWQHWNLAGARLIFLLYRKDQSSGKLRILMKSLANPEKSQKKIKWKKKY